MRFGHPRLGKRRASPARPLLYFVGRLALARAHPAMIEGHDLECRGKGGHLCHPVGAAFAKPRHEHDGCTCAGIVIGARSAIGRNHQHCHVAIRLGWVEGAGRVMFLDKAWSRPPRPLPQLQTNLSLPSRAAAANHGVNLLSRCCSRGSLGLRYASIPRRRISNAIVCDFRKRISSIRRSSLSSVRVSSALSWWASSTFLPPKLINSFRLRSLGELKAAESSVFVALQAGTHHFALHGIIERDPRLF